MSENQITRREFMNRSGKTAAGVGLAAAAASAPAQAAQNRAARDRRTIGANDKIRMALIGCGGMGRANMRSFMKRDDVEIVGVCDVDSRRQAETAAEVEKKYGRRPYADKDYRRVLEQRGLDAVIIGTPDHWHALPMIHACELGQDVYVEKPISHNIVEGRAMVNAAKKFGSVVQVGTWQRSVQHFIDAIDYVRSGKLGKVSVVRTWKVGADGIGSMEPQPAPDFLDWDMWLGPAPYVAFRPNRCHLLNKGSSPFRWFYDYASGMTGDWGVHLIDIALLGMNVWHPSQVSSVGGKIISGPQDDRTTPDTQIAIYKFNNPEFVLHWEVHVGAPGLDGGGDHGIEFIGSDQIVMVNRGGWSISDKKLNPVTKTASLRRVDSYSKNGLDNHTANFLDCMRSRETPRSDIETMHYTTVACHLGNLAYRTGETVAWDPRTERVTNNRDVMKDIIYRREYRKPWKLPMHRPSG
ncbi:MAG: Gfo/Idh/MocA family oxidoreductase [Armatimonadetes bacterium]|nr:Gfo/Idh/MocA family oxidoreductase [Armatimonadota bacterium]